MILDNLAQIRYRATSAARRAGRDPERVQIVVVTKYAPLDKVRLVCESGLVSQIGESRIQDADAKREALGPAAARVRWRMIGHLQTNKAKKAIDIFDTVDSVDSMKVAAALDSAAAARQKTLPVLLQVKLTEKETQSGFSPEQVGEALAGLRAHRNLKVDGLMAIAPQSEDPQLLRPYFRSMRVLFERYFADSPDAQLSMGMSEDFEVAIEEGATMVRLGRIVFSES